MPYSVPRWSRRRQRAGVNYWPRRTSAGVAAFSPLSLSPALWLKADAGTLQTSGGSAATADGDLVGQLLDQSGNGNHVSNTGSARPTLKLAIQNGLPVLRLDGVDDNIAVSLARSQPTTAFAVAKKTATGNLYLIDGNGNQNSLISPDGTHYRIYSGAVLDAAATPANWNVVAAVFNGASSKLSVNGVVTSGNAGTTNAISTVIGVNGLGSAGTFWGGDVGEVLIYNTALSDANRALVETYLNSRWGVY